MKIELKSKRFINPQGYTLVKVSEEHDSAVYDFRLSADQPLIYQCGDGTDLKPVHYNRTDLGSIPRFIQSLPHLQRDHYLLSYLFHDSAYHYHGLLFRGISSEYFNFRYYTRTQADSLLREMIRVEGGNLLQSGIIWLAVRLVGGWAWKHNNRNIRVIRSINND